MTTLPYRDSTLPTTQRVDDLLARMTLTEKAGLLFHAMIGIGHGGSLAGADPYRGLLDTEHMVLELGMNHFNLINAGPPREMAQWHNRLQDLARSTRLGIPVTLSADPRHAYSDDPATVAMTGAFSPWPEPLGLAATRDPGLVERFADCARQEYLAVGIRLALHPQVDLATEPRWARIFGTFGEDAELTCALARAYVRGFQGPRLGPDSVATMTKHFPGGGPQKDGEDPHFRYGREQVYLGGNFAHHLKPFAAAIEAGTAQIMPYYGMPVGIGYEPVGFGFNNGVITGLLREQMGFDGIVCTDWGLLTDFEFRDQPISARAWGVEQLSPIDRAGKVLAAGADQFGGEARPDLVIELVRTGQVGEDRLDISVRRLLREKFVLGLFDQPYVDPDLAEQTVGRADLQTAGLAAQRASVTLLTNAGPGSPARLPLRHGLRVYPQGLTADGAARCGALVGRPEQAEVAILRLQAPYEPRRNGFESFFHAGSLAYAPERRAEILAVTDTVPTIVDVHLNRPAVIPELASHAAALVATFGVSDEALVDVLTGLDSPRGRLPFDLPRSMAAVEASRPDVPFDTADPVFRFGDGIDY